LHLFLHDFGSPLAQMPVTLPDVAPTNKADLNTLRWAARSDGHSGYVFVNNYQRLQPMPAHDAVQFKLNLSGRDILFPAAPVTIPADEFFIWPFNLDLDGAKLAYATAQPICRGADGQTIYFAQIPGVKADFVFDAQTLANSTSPSEFKDVQPGRETAFTVKSKSGEAVKIILLNEAGSLLLHQDERGRVGFDQPAKETFVEVRTELLRPAGPAREIPLSQGRSHIALAPTEFDFTNAAIYRISLPKPIALGADPLLCIHYLGDVARVTLNGQLIDDNFYSGRDFEIGLRRYGKAILGGDLQLQILPLRKDAPIFFEPSLRPDFGTNETLLKLPAVGLVNRR
jgi:beta-galactosidase